MEEMQARAASGKSDRNLARMWASHTHDLEVDRQGRIVVPARMRQYAALESDVTVVGSDRQGRAVGPGPLADEHRTRGAALHRGCGRLSAVATVSRRRRGRTRRRSHTEQAHRDRSRRRRGGTRRRDRDGRRRHGPSTRNMRSPSAGSVEDSSSARFQPSRRSNPPDGIPPVEGLRMRQVFNHEPVMVDEVVALFAPVPAGVVIDATAGGAGTPRRCSTPIRICACSCLDRDPDAVAAATERLGRLRRPGRGAPRPLRPPGRRSPPRSGSTRDRRAVSCSTWA